MLHNNTQEPSIDSPTGRVGYASVGDRYLKGQLAEATTLPLEEISEIASMGLFPAASCDPICGPSWSKAEVDAWTAAMIGGIL